MADENENTPSKSVHLTPEAPVNSPTLATVTTGPRQVVVNVPKATPIQSEATPNATEAEGPVKKGDIVGQVADVTGLKKADVRTAVDAFLTILEGHLGAGKDLQVPPLGKIKVVKSKAVGKGATAFTLKIRTPNSHNS